MRHHLHHRLLLLDVRRDLVCHADVRLAHVLQSSGYYSSALVGSNVLLPHGHLVHPLRPHCGHPSYRRGVPLEFLVSLKSKYFQPTACYQKLTAMIPFVNVWRSKGGWRLCERHLFCRLQELQVPCWICAGTHWSGARRWWLLPHPG